MTFSISARCAQSGMFGIAVSSSSPAVAARCAHARAGVGVVATQNITDPRLGPAGLDLLAAGACAEDVLAILQERSGETAPYRQLAVVDAEGRSGAFSGARSLGRHADYADRAVVAAGNMLVDPELPKTMVKAFNQAADRPLGDRLIHALECALVDGGEEGPVHSAGMIIVDDQAWPLVDLRVDWSEDPVGDLKALWALWQPQMHDYVTRGLNPQSAPAYGVPGDQ